MSDTTAKAPATLTIADLVTALREVVGSSAPAEPKKTGPNRFQMTAAAVKAGKSMTEAMMEAGFGPKFVAGHARNFAGFLVKQKLLTPAQAERTRPGAAAAPPEIPESAGEE